MGVRVRIPTLLRPAVDGHRIVETAPGTVGEVLASVGVRYPRFHEVAFERDGTLKRYLAVFVGDRDARHLRGLDTPVPDGAEVIVLPAAAGGSP